MKSSNAASSLSLFQKSLRYWDHYWFSPAPLFNLAACRVVIVAFQLYHLCLHDYHGKLLKQATIPTVQYNPLPIFQLLNAPFPWHQPPIMAVNMAYFATIFAGFFALLGWRSRFGLSLFAVGNLYLQAYLYSFGRVHHSEALLILTLIVLAIAPSGSTLSVDNLRSRLRQNVRKGHFQPFNILQDQHMSARWPLVLIQWLFAIVYFSAGIHKISGSGGALISFDWLNGYTLQHYLLEDGLKWGSELGVWLSQFHHLAIVASWTAVLFEITFCSVLLFPRLVWLYIPLGAMLHTGIYMAQRAPFFQFVALYAVFVPWTVAVKRIANLLKWSDEQRTVQVFFNGYSPSVSRTMTILCYFDIFGRIQYHSSHENENKICVMEPNGAMTQGFYAIRALTRYVPLLWPLWIVLHLPNVDTASSKLYQQMVIQH